MGSDRECDEVDNPDRGKHLSLRRETLVPIHEAETLWGQPSISTLRAWVTKGVKTAGGSVLLERVEIGGSIFTSVEAFERFIISQNAPNLVHYMLGETVVPMKIARRHVPRRLIPLLETFRIGWKRFTSEEAIARTLNAHQVYA